MGEKNRHFSREFKRDTVQFVTEKIKSIKETWDRWQERLLIPPRQYPEKWNMAREIEMKSI